MGIELPAELAEVAAATGARWPQVDEDAMREQAAAWRGTQQRVDTLAGDADTAASGALDSLSGASGEAATTAWSGFVDPDEGHLGALTRGAARAADRLEAAADEVGAAKVAMVRQLVDAAKNRDAAGCVAGVGHPAALLGTDTTTRGAATNLGALSGGLATAVGPDGDQPVAGLAEIVDPHPGAHTSDGQAGLIGASTGVRESTVDQALGPVHTPFAGNTDDDGFAGPGRGVGHVFGGAGDEADPGPVGAGARPPEIGETPHVVHGPGIGVAPGGVAAGPQQQDMLAGLAGTATHEEFVGDTGAEAGTGPIPTAEPETPKRGTPGPYGGLLGGGGFAGVPTPQAGVPLAPSSSAQTSAAGFTDGAPSVNPAAGPSGAAAPGLPPSVPGAAAAPAPPQPSGAGAPGIAPMPGGGGTRQPPRPVAGDPGGYGTRTPGLGPHYGGPGPPGVRPGQAPPGVGTPGGSPPVPARAAASERAARAVPEVPREQRANTAALFVVHMFPIGHLPVASDRPARQLPPPSEEIDFGGGLRLGPGDHPESARLDTSGLSAGDAGSACAPTPRDELALPPSELTEGYAPLAGLAQRDWNRRYLAREGAADAEYVWPPGELHPEGCVAAGEAVWVPAGTELDRFGDHEGRVFAPAGTPFAARALSPAHLRAGYRTYRVCRAVPMWRAESAPWFGQPGGGTRYRALYSAAELMAFGYLEETTAEGAGQQ